MSMIGQEISHYRIESRVGGGGMGVIYKARDLDLDRTVALKFLPPQLSDDPEAKERFLREAKAASALDHPNICTIHEIAETDDGQLFIVMAHYEGETLEARIRRRGALPIAETLSLIWQIAEGLGRSHDRDIVHRDVKPANVFVTHDEQVKILDFGLAKVQGQGQSFAGLTQGTPAYMAPEQIRGSAPDPRNDLWSVGVLLYEMLTGQSPFRGDSIPEIVAAIFAGPPPPLQENRPEIPAGLGRIVGQLLDQEPDGRPRSCAALLEQLEPFLETIPPVASASGRWRIARPRPPRRRFLAVGAITVAAAVGFWLLHGRLGDPPGDTAGSQVAGPETPQRTSLAVLFFDNLSGQPELDWLRTGLADMLVTDLSQSDTLDVVSTAQLVRVLATDGDPLESQTSAAEIARTLAERLPVDRVVLGSVVESGGTLRIQIQIQEADSGKILDTRRVEGDGQAGLFAMVDTLSHGIRQQLELPAPESRPTDLAVADLTTDSVEALRFYTEGMRLHLQFKESEAIELFRRATELDPDFGMAWAKMAVTARNLGRPDARSHAARAMESDSLDPRERHYIEGFYHSFEVVTWGRAIEAFATAVALDPDFHAARQNLTLFSGYLELADQAIAHGEELMLRGSRSRGGFATLAELYTAAGQAERAEALLRDLGRQRPHDFAAPSALGWLYRRTGRLDEAVEQLELSSSRRPGVPHNFEGLCSVQILREDWPQVEALIDGARALAEPGLHGLADECWALAASHRGRFREAVRQALAALESGLPRQTRASIELRLARLQLARGAVGESRRWAERARTEGRNTLVEPRALLWAGAAALAEEDRAAAEGYAQELDRLAERIPGPIVRRAHHHLLGRLALAGDDPQAARSHLVAATASLPPVAVLSAFHEPDHVMVRSALAEAHRRLGNAADELAELEALHDVTDARLADPIGWVAAMARLSELWHEQGEEARARTLRRRLDSLWSDADRDLFDGPPAALVALRDS